MKPAVFVMALALLWACASRKAATQTDLGEGNTRTRAVVSLNEQTYLLTDASKDPTYGYSYKNPVKVGGSKELSGPMNERRFLNALLGPNGEEVSYFREGSCCHFRTPNGIMNNMGLLDHYRLTWKGATDTLDININRYDEGDLQIPLGLTAKKK